MIHLGWKKAVGLATAGLALISLMEWSEIAPGWAQSTDFETLLQDADAAFGEGHLDEAAQAYQKAYDSLQPIDESKVEQALDTIARWAGFLGAQGENERALALYEEGVALCRTYDNPQLVSYLQIAGDEYGTQGNWAQKIDYYEQALKVQETALGPEAPSVANDQKKLVGLYMEAGYQDKAKALLLRMIDLRRALDGPNRIAVVGPLIDLAQLYFDSEDPKDKAQAKAYYLEANNAIAWAEKTYPKDPRTEMVRPYKEKITTALLFLKNIP